MRSIQLGVFGPERINTVVTSVGEQDINIRVLQMIRNEHIKVRASPFAPGNPQPTRRVLFVQYGVPIIKYHRNGFKPRARQLVLTQTAAYMVEEAKIKQRVLYTVLKGQGSMVTCSFLLMLHVCVAAGISVSNLTDSIVVFHITCEDPKQKVCGCLGGENH